MHIHTKFNTQSFKQKEINNQSTVERSTSRQFIIFPNRINSQQALKRNDTSLKKRGKKRRFMQNEHQPPISFAQQFNSIVHLPCIRHKWVFRAAELHKTYSLYNHIKTIWTDNKMNTVCTPELTINIKMGKLHSLFLTEYPITLKSA